MISSSPFHSPCDIRGLPAALPLAQPRWRATAVHDSILAEDYVGIIENARRALERDATVIQLVDPVFLAVPSNRIVIQDA
jgi:hypothetical protein